MKYLFNSEKLFNSVRLLIVFSIVFLVLAIIEIKRTNREYLKSNKIVTINNDLDKLFKDLVYLPLIVAPQNVSLIERQTTNTIIDKIIELQKVVSDQMPFSRPVAELEAKWNELIISFNPEKLNILYDLEQIHNTLDRQVSERILFIQNSGTRNSNILLMIAFSFLTCSFILIFFALKFKKTEMLNVENEKDKAVNTANSLTTFVELIAHELKTPLIGIVGLADILRKSNLPENETFYADNLYHSGKVLTLIINKIFEFSNVKFQKIEPENSSFSLGTVLQQNFIIFNPLALEKNIKFNLITDSELPQFVYGDSARLTHVLFHLVGNAIKYTLEGEVTLKVMVSSKNPNNELVLYFSVEDTGFGLSETQIRNILPPLSDIQINSKPGDVYPGLGLAVCNQFVKAMGGSIELKQGKNNGSIFSFYVKFSHCSKENLVSDFLNKNFSLNDYRLITPMFDKNNKPLIMVVDDNQANLLIVQVMLKRLGAKVVTANNGKEALSEFPWSKIDLMLIDCQMPEMDGYETVKNLRAKNIWIPIFAMSSTINFEIQYKCHRSGMNDVIPKPVQIENLISKIKIALNPEPVFIAKEISDQFDIVEDAKIANEIYGKTHSASVRFISKLSEHIIPSEASF